ncbi:DUF6263 family protein [uncultured Chryseobacterium sp.]|uniref:DUF6263 family protein n=1 Tax=uncultured Chryseobacterium sp. TaxID=259322 RepID=UPI0025E6EB2E|nr:DUF6263 family protein [uncultured Chryseobacterium sp.]
MKFIYLLLSLIFFAGCAQNQKEIALEYRPSGTITYQYDMNSKQLNIKGNLKTDYTKNDDLVNMNVEVESLSAESDDHQDLGYGEFVGQTYTRTYTKYGASADLDNVPKQIINMEVFVVEFPKTPVKVGSRWKSKKTAKPDMFFEFIDTEYVCTSVKDDVVMIKAVMNFVSSDKYSSQMKLTRKYEGEYMINPKNGVVTHAKFYMDMFSGFSELKGSFEIRMVQ